MTAGTTAAEWRYGSGSLPLGARTLLAGIVNLTPDSFSDGGLYNTPSAGVDHALRLLDDGADMLDIGGESTRPGAPALTPAAISAQVEQERILPAICSILRARPGAVISVDTYRASTAQRALDAGAQIVNDVSGLLWDPAMARTVAAAGCGVVLMHTRGLPSQWASQPPLPQDEVIPTILHGLADRLAVAIAAGIAAENIVLDPGFGFGKRGSENWTLLDHLVDLQELGRPLLVGLSRKGFLTAGQPDATLADRDAATRTANARAVQQGARILRVHEVKQARLALP